MDNICEGITADLESGDSDRVNDAIEEIKEKDIEERIELFNVSFDSLTEMYASSEDGYVRQSIVRVVEVLTPGLVAVFAVDEDDRSIGVDRADIRDQTDAVCGFLLEAITDDDGRVRRAAKGGLQDVFRTYDALEDQETIKALILELDKMAVDASGKQEKHLRESKADAQFALRSGWGQLVEEYHEEFGDSFLSNE